MFSNTYYNSPIMTTAEGVYLKRGGSRIFYRDGGVFHNSEEVNQFVQLVIKKKKM